MENINSLSNSFERTLKDSNLQSVATDLSEIIIDGVLKDGITKDIPIIGTIVGIGKTINNVNESLFLKKLIYFISEIKETNAFERNKMISEIENSKKYRVKVGEKLLYIIDKCDDHLNSEYVAKMFRAYLNKQLSYSDFLRSASIIQDILIDDLEEFLSTENHRLEKSFDRFWDEYIGDFESSLINKGLCMSMTGELSVREEDDPSDWDNNKKLVTEGGKVEIKITDIGKKIKNILKN
jgi:hypothetical protein